MSERTLNDIEAARIGRTLMDMLPSGYHGSPIEYVHDLQVAAGTLVNAVNETYRAGDGYVKPQTREAVVSLLP